MDDGAPLRHYLDEHFREEWSFSWMTSETLQQGVRDAMDGGKRVRPLLCLTAARAVDGDMEQAAALARCVELVHSFTLVHDDIQDGDRYRRGSESIWSRYGEAQAITVGDALHAAAFDQLVARRDIFDEDTFQQLLGLLTDAVTDLSDGQARDVDFRSRSDISFDEYMAMVRKKTGALIRLSTCGGARTGDPPQRVMDVLEEFSGLAGPAFQIRDDVIDLEGGKGRPRGNDVREGKRSLPVVNALSRLDGDRRAGLLELLDRPRAETGDEDVRDAVDLLRSVNAIEDANAEAERMAEEAVALLDGCERLRSTDLVEMAEFLVERQF